MSLISYNICDYVIKIFQKSKLFLSFQDKWMKILTNFWFLTISKFMYIFSKYITIFHFPNINLIHLFWFHKSFHSKSFSFFKNSLQFISTRAWCYFSYFRKICSFANSEFYRSHNPSFYKIIFGVVYRKETFIICTIYLQNYVISINKI